MIYIYCIVQPFISQVEIELVPSQVPPSEFRLDHRRHQSRDLRDPSEVISEIWEEPPPRGHIHISSSYM